MRIHLLVMEVSMVDEGSMPADQGGAAAARGIAEVVTPVIVGGAAERAAVVGVGGVGGGGGGGGMSYTRKVCIAVGISLAAVLCAIFVYVTAEILVLLFAGLLVAVFLSAPSDVLARWARVPRAYALLVVLAVLVIVVCGGGYFMGFTVYKQTQELTRTLPVAMEQFEGDLQNLLPGKALEEAASEPAATGAASAPLAASRPATATGVAATAPAAEPTPRQWVAKRLIELRRSATDFLMSESFVKGAGGVAGNVVTSTLGVIGNIAVVLAVGLFFAINPGLYRRGVVLMFPVGRRGRVGQILSEVGSQLQWWFVGQLCSMASIGVLTFIGLSILRIPMTTTLAILAGLLNFIPNFGPILAATPAVLVAFAPHGAQTDLNPSLAGWTILMYVVIQILEGWVITPFFQQRAVELPPALIVIAQVLFALLLGPVGLVLATPMLAATLVIFRMVYVEDILGDRPATT
ncbi:MAG TPA: AI-2E family transporter [Phycisphaerae bacterium]|nr:AI-2E family transporter [Phycisphaerae bacterium]